MKVHSKSPYESQYGFCRARRDGERLLVAGTAPIPQDGSAPPEDAHAQMLLCGEIATRALRALGAKVDQVTRTRMYITSAEDADAVGRAHKVVFGEAEPVATMVVVSALLDPRWKVEIEVEARAKT